MKRYRVLHTATADTGHSLLVKDEEIVFVVGDVEDDATPAQAQARLLENRTHIAWARLPSAVLLPTTYADQQVTLRDSGVMGLCLSNHWMVLSFRTISAAAGRS